LEVIADGKGFEGNTRELDAHLLDEVEEVLGGEGARSETGGEETEIGRGEGDRFDGRDGGLAEVAQDLPTRLLLPRVPDILDLVVVGSGSTLTGEGLGNDPRHAPIIGTMRDKGFPRGGGGL
jgi:hypothetical protein